MRVAAPDFTKVEGTFKSDASRKYLMKRMIPVFLLSLLLLSGLVSCSRSFPAGDENGTYGGMSNNSQPNETFSWLPNMNSIIILLILLAALLAGAVALVYLKSKKNSPVTAEGEVIELKTGRAFGISHVGGRENNEDNMLILKLPDAYLLAVADGLGGHNAGEVASKIAIDTLREVFKEEYRKRMSENEVKSLLRKVHLLSHERIKESAVGEYKGMGTTLVTAFIRNGKVIVANTGDSRAYLIKDGKILARTKDHSLIQELLDKGELTGKDAKKHPMKNVITKALGSDFGVDIYEWMLEDGGVILLNSDGLSDYIDERRIAEIATGRNSAKEIAMRLVDEALPVTKDNVTVVVWR